MVSFQIFLEKNNDDKENIDEHDKLQVKKALTTESGNSWN